MRSRENILTPTVFHILLALRGGERHGYEIIKQIEHDTQGSIKLLTGTLYGAIKRLLSEGLIAEKHLPASEQDDPRRRYYVLTSDGLKALTQELARYQLAVGAALENNLLSPLAYV